MTNCDFCGERRATHGVWWGEIPIYNPETYEYDRHFSVPRVSRRRPFACQPCAYRQAELENQRHETAVLAHD